MLWPPIVAALALASHPPGASGPALSEAEQKFCADELAVLERRRKLFQAQGQSASEIARKNEQYVDALAECRDRFKKQSRRELEQKQDLEEAARRAGPDATEFERNRAWREVRRERLSSKNPSSLTKEEKEELDSGMGDEMAATHQTLDDANSRDPSFMRVIHSALSCYHTNRSNELKDRIASEENLVKLGTGDRNKLYALRSELRQSGEVLARSREAARDLPGGLERCASTTVAVVTHCLAVRFTGDHEAACESEEIQQYVRFVK